jgi:hypothetical protein
MLCIVEFQIQLRGTGKQYVTVFSGDGSDRILYETPRMMVPYAHVPPNLARRPVALQLRK